MQQLKKFLNKLLNLENLYLKQPLKFKLVMLIMQLNLKVTSSRFIFRASRSIDEILIRLPLLRAVSSNFEIVAHKPQARQPYEARRIPLYARHPPRHVSRQLWTMRQFSGFATAEETNAAIAICWRRARPDSRWRSICRR